MMAGLWKRVHAASAVCSLVMGSLLHGVAAADAPKCPPDAPQLTAQKAQELGRAAKDHGILWKFEKNGRTGYLYGTIHVNKLDWLFPGPKTMAAFRESEVLALELDLSNPEVLKKASQPEMLGIKPLVLPAAMQQRMNALAGQVCAPPSLMAGRHAVMQLITVTIFDARFIGLEAMYGTDFFLAGLAQSSGKPVRGLETPELQMRALLGGNEKEMLEMIDGGMKLFTDNKQREQTARLVADWGSGNLVDLQNFEQWCDCVGTAAERKFLKQVNDDRNAGLAAAIDKLHGEGRRVFAAIGTLHMAGPQAVTRLLAGMGYKVERVSFASKP